LLTRSIDRLQSDIFSFASARRGVFANVALTEPFGLGALSSHH